MGFDSNDVHQELICFSFECFFRRIEMDCYSRYFFSIISSHDIFLFQILKLYSFPLFVFTLIRLGKLIYFIVIAGT